MSKVRVKVIPKSSQERLVFEGDTLKIWLHAPPAEGQANHRLVEILAKKFRVSKSSVEICSGSTGRNKIVDIVGVSLDEMKKLLN